MNEPAEQNAAIFADFQMHKLDKHLDEIARLRAEVGPRPPVTREAADLLYQLHLEVQRAAVVAEDISWHFARATRAAASARPSAKAKQQPATWTREAIVVAARGWHEANGRPPMADEWRLADPTGQRPTVSQVLTMFVKWNDMLEAAGFSRRTGGHGNVSRPVEDAA